MHNATYPDQPDASTTRFGEFMSFNGKLVAAAALMALASAGRAYAVPTIVAAPSGQYSFSDAGAGPHGGAYHSVADFSLRAVGPRDAANGPAAVHRARGALEVETSPYTMLLMGAGMLLLVGRGRNQSTPWAASPVEEPREGDAPGGVSSLF